MAAFPTLDEGFGLPALEAQACGAPLVRSAIPVLDEVAGDASLAVDPTDERAWAEALALLSRDVCRRRRLSESGVARARRFPWSDTAEATWRVYQEVLAA